MSKSVLVRGWASVGSHGKPFVTASTPHPACIGRFEIYETKEDALRNAVSAVYVKKCTIRIEK